jgi:translation initiation factor IF-2
VGRIGGPDGGNRLLVKLRQGGNQVIDIGVIVADGTDGFVEEIVALTIHRSL